ncbi:MAG: cupin [Shinella sp.]|nr:cupin [Shinella sp.]
MQIETVLFGPSDWVPNNRTLPVLLYRGALAGERNLVRAFEDRFHANGWGGSWVNGVFSYHHFHTRGHEVLGIAAGSATLLIGGPTGRSFDVGAGDALVLPAGTGHRRMEAGSDFLVVGAYPPGQFADIRTERATPAELAAIAAVPLPEADPIGGQSGALRQHWRSAG